MCSWGEFNREKIAILLFGLVVGRLIGHKLSIYRDKRKEFNDAVLPIKNFLIKERAIPTPSCPIPDVTDITLVASMLSRKESRLFFKSWGKYKEARQNSKGREKGGGVFYTDTKEIQQSIDDLLLFLKRR